MKNMLEVQDRFNNEFNFHELKEITYNYIEKILNESEDEFFYDYSKNEKEIRELRKMRIEYDLTQLIINRMGCNPIFTLKFNLYKAKEETPNYTYEVEYNMNGEFLDEYFIEY